MRKNILITGGAGFIGINSAKHFLDKGDQVTILDNFSRPGNDQNVKWLISSSKEKPKVIRADVTKDVKKLNSEVSDADVVLHLAGQVAVTTSVTDPLSDFKINIEGTINVLEAIRRSKARPIIIYSSTNKVYGNLSSEKLLETELGYAFKNKKFGISEDQPLDFKSPYGCSKGAADQYVHDYHNSYGLKTIVFRQSCIYGPHQFGMEDQGWVAWFIIAFLLKRKVAIFGDGKQVRDLLFVTDLVKAYDMAIEKIDKSNGQIYNIGGGIKNSISIWKQLKPILEKLFGTNLNAEYAQERIGDQKIFVSDIRLLDKDLGWKPEVGVKEGIQRMYEWVIGNRDIIKEVAFK